MLPNYRWLALLAFLWGLSQCRWSKNSKKQKCISVIHNRHPSTSCPDSWPIHNKTQLISSLSLWICGTFKTLLCLWNESCNMLNFGSTNWDWDVTRDYIDKWQTCGRAKRVVRLFRKPESVIMFSVPFCATSGATPIQKKHRYGESSSKLHRAGKEKKSQPGNV